jgi:hypothetical protein
MGQVAQALKRPIVELSKRAPWPRAAFGGPGIGRYAVDVGAFPVTRATRHLHEFLNFEPLPLSHRAADGFKGRLDQSSLSRPVEFDDALADYVARAA